MTVKTQKFLTTILGFSRGYVSPEVLDFIKRKENKLLKPGEEINPWKADVYSCGILGLLLFGALKEDPYSTFSQLDSYKEDIINHSYIENLIKNIKCENQEITTKIKYLIGICLQYDPLKRLSFKEINETLERIIEYPNEDIMNLKTKVEEILKMKNESRDQLMKKIQKLERNLELEEKKNETLLNILKEKNQSLELQMRVNEDLKKKLYEEQKNNNSNLSEILNRIKKEINITQSLKEKNFSLENKIKELSKFNFLVKNKIEELKKEINRLTEQMEEKSHIIPNYPQIPIPNHNNYLYYININEKAAIDLHIKDVHDYKKKFRINLYYIGKKYFIDCATFKGFLFCCGGFGKYGFLNTCAILNLENYNIYYSNNLNESKADASLISTKSNLYCIGGINNECLPTCENFNFENNCWIEGPPLNIPDHHLTLGYYDPNIIYCFGGIYHASIEMLNVSNLSNYWETIEIKNVQTREGGCAIKINEDEMLIFGGLSALDCFVIFNTKKKSYNPFNNLTKDCEFSGSKHICLDDLFLIVGTIDGTVKKSFLEFRININRFDFEERKVDF